ncbi:MAG: carbonic anhydrase [Coriobacteriales bacterium]|nr:carbonic anhydrase [Coriobacteriales bacterium]
MSVDTDTALHLLREGNRRFVEGQVRTHYDAAGRASSTEGQFPFAVIVGCSDSRVPVEVVFDVGIGELFVVRTAGHVLSEAGLASVRFAVEKLDVHTIVVLGHEDCGAVSAALAGDAPEWLAPIIDHIDTEIADDDEDPGARLARAVDSHVRDTVDEIGEWLADAGLEQEAIITGAAYELASGRVHWLE